MTTGSWLAQATRRLESAGAGTARLDCLVLLEDVTGKDRAHLLAHPETELTPEQQERLEKLLTRRAQHEPLAYIREKTEFYGREFMVNHHVLEPRPESETMIDLLKSLELPEEITVVDVGTGSGALGITAGQELPDSRTILIDIDNNALGVARQNARTQKVAIKFVQGDLLAPIQDQSAQLGDWVILANLPYVPDTYQINEAALQEPRLAIFGGSDGLDLYRTMFDQLSHFTNKPRYILTESLPFQHESLAGIAAEHNWTQKSEEDFIQLFTQV